MWRQALADRDLAVLIVDASEKFGRGDEFVIKLLNEYSPRTILALNKVDRSAQARFVTTHGSVLEALRI